MKYSPELFEKLVIALNRSTALLMELNNLILEDGYRIDELHKFIESNLELLKRLNGMSKSKRLKATDKKLTIINEFLGTAEKSGNKFSEVEHA